MVIVKLVREFIVRNAADLDATTDFVAEELFNLEGDGLYDADMNADIGASTVELSITAQDVDWDAACQRADSAIRAAIHAAGGATPGWQNPVFDPNGTRYEPIAA